MGTRGEKEGDGVREEGVMGARRRSASVGKRDERQLDESPPAKDGRRTDAAGAAVGAVPFERRGAPEHDQTLPTALGGDARQRVPASRPGIVAPRVDVELGATHAAPHGARSFSKARDLGGSDRASPRSQRACARRENTCARRRALVMRRR